MSVPSQRVILCEGVDDRAFWKGLLEDAGGTSLGGPGQAAPKDPWKKSVTGGAFAFRLPGGQFLRLQPAGGAQSVLKTQALYLGKDTTPCDILVVNIDLDATHAEPAHLASALQSRLQAIRDRLSRAFSEADLDGPGPGPWTVKGTRVFPVIWRADTEDIGRDGVPALGCLEQLVCAALAEVYPLRARDVHKWLSRPPDPPDRREKALAMAHFAKWNAEFGPDEFDQALWRDPDVVAALKRRLAAIGAGRAVQALIAA